jgi:transcription initiation factor TFIIE subunit alpha
MDEVTADAFGNLIPKTSNVTGNDVTTMDNSDDDDAGDVPTIKVGDQEFAITDVTQEIIMLMTPEEQERYTQVFQDHYSHMYD